MTPRHARRGAGSVADRYAAMVASGAISEDVQQRAVVAHLDRLAADLKAGGRAGLLKRFAGRARASPAGLYIDGEVGRGKTMLMDAFFAAVSVPRKRRVHFDAFMSDIQDRIHAARTGGNGGDPIAPVAADVARETRLLCLDEFQVTDIADAMILARLFSALFDRGLVLVATSNVAPEGLYRNGLNRGLFLPFIDVLKSRVTVVHLETPTDYRLARLAGSDVYVTPLGAAAHAALDRLWRRLAGDDPGRPATLRTRGRDIAVPRSAEGIARFAFADLCEAPLGAHDYLQIARAYDTVFVDDIAVIAPERRDVARRFILMVDTFYDLRVKLIASAAAEPAALYAARGGEEAFAFRRTVSRLTEMRSAPYLAAPHGAR